MPNTFANKNHASHLSLTPDLSVQVCALLIEIAHKTARRLNYEEHYATIYLESIYLFMHLLSRLVFYEFGAEQRDAFINYCFDHLTQLLSPQLDQKQLLHYMRHREQFYCRYPCLEEHSTDIGFIPLGINHLLQEIDLPALLINRSALLINDGCLMLLRRLAALQIRLHVPASL